AGQAARAGTRAVRAPAPAGSARGRPAPEPVGAVRGHTAAGPESRQAAEAAGAQHCLRDGTAPRGAAPGRAHARDPGGARTREGRDRRPGVAEGHRMRDMPKHVKIKEVGPREGFQFEKGDIGLASKISLVDALSDTGVGTIEFTSFVSPKWVPQMADAEEMVA